ncbi:MAG: NADH dehydrogenase [Candidatus Amoebophilus sp. 36-38]|nr:MAG: NADH dehydrogenase [Candidatus Amoebophilus sp. 36-38]
MANRIQYDYQPGNFKNADPTKYQLADLKAEEVLINIGPQHPATHGILRLEVILDGEIVVDVVPHLGYLHRCFEKHAATLPYNQIIPYVDRMDYLAAMNSEHAFAMGVERMLGLDGKLSPRVEYIRVLVAEFNRLASHFMAIGTYGIDLGVFTAFLWLMRDREYILRLLEWVSGARMLYNYIWIGGLYYDLPVGFEERCSEFIRYLKPKIKEIERFLIENTLFIQRTAKVGVLPLATAINHGVSGPVLRASGLRFDLRRVDGYSIYPELSFDIPIGQGLVGQLGDCWDRTWVRVQECKESIKIAEQCLERLTTDLKRTPDFDPQKMVPKKIRTHAQDLYTRAENPRGELGFFFRATDHGDKPFRCKARSSSFANLSVVPSIAKGQPLADLIAIIGSIDIVLGEIDR